MSVYVAGSSDELHRARRVMDMYRAAGVEVTSTWVDRVAEAGEGNPRGWSREQRAACAYPCIDQVRAADVLHWLAPAKGHGRGSYWEAALAWVWSKQIVASGDTKQSIFTAIVREVVTDDDAVALIVDAHRRARKIGGDTWSRSIGVNPNAATPITGPVLCTCAECVDNRANAARLGHAVAPATFHEPAVSRTTTPQVDALLDAIVSVRGLPGEPVEIIEHVYDQEAADAVRVYVDPLEVTGVEDSAPLPVEPEKSRAIGKVGE